MRNHMAAGWFYSPEQIVRYFATRVSSLKPPKVSSVRRRRGNVLDASYAE